MLHRMISHYIILYISYYIPIKIFHSESRSFQWWSHEPSDSQELRSHVAGECWQARDQRDELRQAFLRRMPCHVGSPCMFSTMKYVEILVHFLTMTYIYIGNIGGSMNIHELWDTMSHPWTGSCWFSFNTRRGPGGPRAWISMAQMAKVGAWTARDWLCGNHGDIWRYEIESDRRKNGCIIPKKSHSQNSHAKLWQLSWITPNDLRCRVRTRIDPGNYGLGSIWLTLWISFNIYTSTALGAIGCHSITPIRRAFGLPGWDFLPYGCHVNLILTPLTPYFFPKRGNNPQET